jgi:hypothetical protein
MLLTFVTTNRLLSELMEECLLFLHGTFFKWLWTPFSSYGYLWLELVLRPLVTKWCIVFVITMCLKLKEETKILLTFINLIKYGYRVVFENMSLLVSNIKKKVFGVLKSFLSFLRKYENTKTHNMFFLCYLRFKSLRLIYIFIGCKKGMTIVEEYDRRSLYDPMFIKCHHHLHLVSKF